MARPIKRQLCMDVTDDMEWRERAGRSHFLWEIKRSLYFLRSLIVLRHTQAGMFTTLKVPEIQLIYDSLQTESGSNSPVVAGNHQLQWMENDMVQLDTFPAVNTAILLGVFRVMREWVIVLLSKVCSEMSLHIERSLDRKHAYDIENNCLVPLKPLCNKILAMVGIKNYLHKFCQTKYLCCQVSDRIGLKMLNKHELSPLEESLEQINEWQLEVALVVLARNCDYVLPAAETQALLLEEETKEAVRRETIKIINTMRTNKMERKNLFKLLNQVPCPQSTASRANIIYTSRRAKPLVMQIRQLLARPHMHTTQALAQKGHCFTGMEWYYYNHCSKLILGVSIIGYLIAIGKLQTLSEWYQITSWDFAFPSFYYFDYPLHPTRYDVPQEGTVVMLFKHNPRCAMVFIYEDGHLISRSRMIPFWDTIKHWSHLIRNGGQASDVRVQTLARRNMSLEYQSVAALHKLQYATSRNFRRGLQSYCPQHLLEKHFSYN